MNNLLTTCILIVFIYGCTSSESNKILQERISFTPSEKKVEVNDESCFNYTKIDFFSDSYTRIEEKSSFTVDSLPLECIYYTDSFFIINDSLAIVVLDVFIPNISYNYAYIVDCNFNVLDKIQIGEGYDVDGEVSEISIFNYLFLSEKLIEIKRGINDGYEERLEYTYYEIDSSFKKVDNIILKEREHSLASYRILTNEDLNKYSTSELRIIRNEIYASYGYIFKSEDLKDYFNKYNWYEPINEIVNDSLTIIEIMNIDKILKEEG